MSATLSLRGQGVYSSEYGQVLEEPVMHLAQVLRDYNHYFELQFIPERDRTFGDKPYRIVDNTPGLKANIVRYITVEEMRNPAKVLADIFRGDLRHHSPDEILQSMDLEDRAARLLQLKQREEQALEDEELVAFYLAGGRDGRHYLRYGQHKIER